MLDRRATVLPLALAACVLPAAEPTGIELSWRFLEANTIDGEEDVRARSCAAAQVDRVRVDIDDEDSPSRQGSFRFQCADGYQTLTEFQTEASGAFVHLAPGSYTLRLLALDPGSVDPDAEPLETRTVGVSKGQITTEPWNVARAPVDLTITLANATDCGAVTFALYYDDVEAQLPEFSPAQDEEADAPLLYRHSLGSSGGILLDGTPTECAADLDGPHVFSAVDRGAYQLEVAVDGFGCSIRLDIGADGTELPVDLANLPCAG